MARGTERKPFFPLPEATNIVAYKVSLVKYKMGSFLVVCVRSRQRA